MSNRTQAIRPIPEDVQRRAGLTVVEYLGYLMPERVKPALGPAPARRPAHWYRVRFDCCGGMGMLRHSSILNRRAISADGTSMRCQHCRSYLPDIRSERPAPSPGVQANGHHWPALTGWERRT